MDFYIEYISPWLLKLSTYSSLIPFLGGLLLLRKQKKPIHFRLLLSFAALSVFFEAVTLITVKLGTKNNLWTGHVYTFFSFAILATIYYLSFSKALVRRLIIAAVAAFVVLSLYDALVLAGFTKMNSVSRMVANALLMLMAIGYFYKVANSLKVTYLEKDPLFLLSCAVLIYYAGTSMSYALFNQALAVSWDAALICMGVVFVLNIFFYTSQAFILRKMVA